MIFVDFGDSLISFSERTVLIYTSGTTLDMPSYASTEDLWLIYPSNNGYDRNNNIFLSHISRSSFIELLNNNKFDEIIDKLINPIQKAINDSVL